VGSFSGAGDLTGEGGGRVDGVRVTLYAVIAEVGTSSGAPG
jgi:hypothetical protein